MNDRVREPIQTYLTSAEREELDQVAADLGVSRSEVLRRGIRSLSRARYAGRLRDLVDDGLVTPPVAESSDPPPSRPVAPLVELLDELAADRADR